MKILATMILSFLNISMLWAATIGETNIRGEEVRKCFAAIRYARDGEKEAEFLEVWKNTPPRMERFNVNTFSIFGKEVSKREEYGYLIDAGTGVMFVAMPGANLLRDLGVLKSGEADLQTTSRQKPTFNHTTIGGTGQTGKGGCQKGYLEMYQSCSEAIRKFGTTFEGGKPRQIILTGHSLGGALAQLGAFDLRNHFNLTKDGEVRLVTFGSPRVYNAVSSGLFDTHIGKANHLRFITTYTEGSIGAVARNVVNVLAFRWGEVRGGREVRKDHFAEGTDCPGLNINFASVRKKYKHTGTELKLATDFSGEDQAVQAHLFLGYDGALSTFLS